MLLSTVQFCRLLLGFVHLLLLLLPNFAIFWMFRNTYIHTYVRLPFFPIGFVWLSLCMILLVCNGNFTYCVNFGNCCSNQWKKIVHAKYLFGSRWNEPLIGLCYFVADCNFPAKDLCNNRNAFDLNFTKYYHSYTRKYIIIIQYLLKIRFINLDWGNDTLGGLIRRSCDSSCDEL